MKPLIFLVSSLFLLCCVPINQPSTSSSTSSKVSVKKLRYEDYIYEPSIKTVQLSPISSTLLPAVTIVRSQSLLLSFDDLSEKADYYRVMLLNANQKWKPSRLNSLEYLTDYNEFDITDYEFSFDTQTPYVHYTFVLPPVKRSGNYLMVVYRGDNKQDIILSKRMMIVEQLVDVAPTASTIGLNNLSAFNQQISFSIRYPNYEIENPISNVNVSIRQNQRDDNQITGLKPSFIREELKELKYRFFDHQSAFSAANEYRFFDLKSLIYPGQNVKAVNRNTAPPKTIIETDRPRTNLAYTEYEDKNGQYIISSHESVNGQYTSVTFNLDCERIEYKGDAYVFGEFTDWKISDKYRMKYNSSSSLHSTEVLLKQGYYEYQYLIKNDSIPEYYLEGNHEQSDNDYEIFVYYKPYNERSDLLVGYYTKRGKKKY